MQHLLLFLTASPSDESASTLLVDTLAALSSAARSSTPAPDTTDSDPFQTAQAAACVPALVQLLKQVATAHSSICTPVLSQWFRSSIADASEAFPSSVLSQLLPVVIPALRSSEATVSDSRVATLTQHQLDHAAKLPPVAALLSQSSNPDKLADVLQTLDTICACFPCPATPSAVSTSEQTATAVGESSTDAEVFATAAERQGLLAAALRQMQGERSVALAAAAARRVTDGQEAESSSAAADSFDSTAGRCVPSIGTHA